ncbi:hypothetical protein AN478_03845 [Thiohalorhabdus denitrificans]|uniref:Protein TonB n=1 Tax=Thiohalorhabdus denitrificans TaxID=381306 RepID=A0A0P9CPQ9_9GAMM|nr:hypothetical protein [Thiohalorhabdus denitrificans]KPV41066.1 hypothetical protein AN478_03845 [Thiohalorhabdus denitrificans]SCY39904.1 protein TonB [Thiohalorhabdus denitrificans]
MRNRFRWRAPGRWGVPILAVALGLAAAPAGAGDAGEEAAPVEEPPAEAGPPEAEQPAAAPPEPESAPEPPPGLDRSFPVEPGPPASGDDERDCCSMEH